MYIISHIIGNSTLRRSDLVKILLFSLIYACVYYLEIVLVNRRNTHEPIVVEMVKFHCL